MLSKALSPPVDNRDRDNNDGDDDDGHREQSLANLSLFFFSKESSLFS